MRHLITIIVLCLIHTTSASGQTVKSAPFSIGETLEFNSKVLKEGRSINVYLPESYKHDTSKEYPVIYLLDGSRDEDFIHVSGLVQFCSFSWINIIEESIVIGIGNVDRKKDFTYPSTIERDIKEFPTTGKSEAFIRFLKDELQPMVDNRYRTKESKTIIGQSLGGLLATEILFKSPEMFDNYIIVSPSLWWDDEKLLKYPLGDKLSKKSIFIGVGNEGPGMKRVAQTLFHKLSIEKKSTNRLFFEYFDKQSHGDALHLALYAAFEKLFAKENQKK